MPRNGSGTFAAAASSVNPAVASTTIDPTAFNTLIDDVEQALTDSIAKDGQTTPTANLPMGGFRHTGVGAGATGTSYLQIAQHQANGTVYAVATGTNTMAASLSPAATAYTAGMAVDVEAAATNTGAVTLNINSLGARDVVKQSGDAVVAGDIVEGGIYRFVYDGDNFILQTAGAPSINTLTEETAAAEDDYVAIYDTSGAAIRKQSTRDMMSTMMPAGAVMPYAGTSAPTGWLLCYGQDVSRTTYADLFSAISTTYGVGDGSTTFTLPDLRGRVVAGKDDMGGASADRLTDQSGGLDGDTLGDTGGSETHTLTTAELPAHGHPFRISVENGGNADVSGGFMLNSQESSTQAAFTGAPSGTAGEQIGGTGDGTAHNNVQPTIVLNYIIKT